MKKKYFDEIISYLEREELTVSFFEKGSLTISEAVEQEIFFNDSKIEELLLKIYKRIKK